MPIQLTEVAAGAGLALRGEGLVTGAELIETNQRISALGKLQSWAFALLDLTAVESFECSTSELRLLAEKDKALAARMRVGALVCIAASDKFIFGLARMWQVFSQETGWHTRVVRTRAEGEAWIRREAARRLDVTLPPEPF